MRRVCNGIPVVGGISIGTAKVTSPRRLPEMEADIARAYPVDTGGVDWATALSPRGWGHDEAWVATAAAVSFLTTALQQKAAAELGESAANVFEAQRAIVSDPLLEVAVFSRVEQGLTLPHAVYGAISEIVASLKVLDDEETRARAVDVYDVGLRFMAALTGIGTMFASEEGEVEPMLIMRGPLESEGILVAHDLLPSELTMLDRRMLLGLVLEGGLERSSVGVIARALGCPTVIQVSGVLSGLTDGEAIIVDADSGLVILDPCETELRDYASMILQTTRQTFRQATQTIIQQEAGKPPEYLS